MDFLMRKILFPSFFVLLLVACPALGRDHDHHNYHHNNFSYNDQSPNGPSHWGTIKPEWSTCSNGKMQSPVDISNNRVVVAPNLGPLMRKYKPSEASLVNEGYQIALEWEDSGGYIYINGILYKLKECHWHVPSEHLINGRRFDLEIHLVHESLNGNITVVGMVYEIGEPDPFLSMIQDEIKEIVDTIDEKRSIGFVNPERINIGNGRYYRYKGSLTTPPFTEHVVWTVMGKVSSVSKEQVELIRKALVDEPKTNARPVQPLNNRIIKFYKPIVPLN